MSHGNPDSPSAPRARVSSGILGNWRILTVAAAGQSLGIGLVGSYQVLVTPLVAEFGASQTQMGIGMTLLLASSGIAAMLMGPVADRGPLRWVMVSGALAMLGSVFALASAQSLTELALWGTLFGAAVATYGHVPANVLLLNWFEERRGTAVAIAAMGMSIAGMGIPPGLTWLVDHFGWRESVSIVASGIALVLIPIFFYWVRKKPGSAKPELDGDSTRKDLPASDPARGILSQGNFWKLALGLGLATSAAVGLSVFLIPYLEGMGVSRQSAAWAPATLAASSLIAKPTVGVWVDRIPLPRVIAAVLALYTCGWTLLALGSNFTSALLSCALLGVGTGGLLVIGPVVIGATFGEDVVGRVTGFQVPVAMPFILGVPPALGSVRDVTGSFAPGFAALAGLVVAAAFLLLSIRFREQAPQGA